MLLNNNLYKIKYIYYTDFLKMPLQARAQHSCFETH